MPLGMARLVASRITEALEPDLPLAIVLPSVATTAAATTDSLVPPTEDPPGSRIPISRPVSTKPAPTEPGPTVDALTFMPTLASLAAARSESEGTLDRIIVSGTPEHALLYTPRSRSEGPPKTLSFPSLGAAVIRPSTSPPPPPVRATPAEIERLKRVLQHLEEHAPDPHVAHLRVALRAGLTPLALANPEALGPNTLVLIETAVEEILGTDLSTLGASS
jgi:hypothetical protein